MKLTLGELAQKSGATLSRGNAELAIEGISSLAEAGAQHLAPFTDPTYLPQLKLTKAGAVLCKTQELAAEAPAGAALLLAADPEITLIKILGLLYPEPHESAGVDPKAVVEPNVELGANAYIGPFAVVRSGSKIGRGCTVHAHSFVGRNCVLGEGTVLHARATLYDGVQLGQRVIVHSGAVLGADGFGYKFRGGKHVKVPQVGNVVIGDDVEIGANTCIDRAALGSTRVGTGSKIDNLVQIGHNNVIGNHCILCGQVALAGSCELGDYVVLGGNVGVADHIKMGAGSRAGAKSGIGKDVPPGVEMWGMYAVERRAAFKQLVAYNRLPELVERMRTLEAKVKALGGAAE